MKPRRVQTHVDESGVVPLLQVMQHGGLVQAGELRHVLHLAELGWVHLLNVVLVHLHLRFRDDGDRRPDQTRVAGAERSRTNGSDSPFCQNPSARPCTRPRAPPSRSRARSPASPKGSTPASWRPNPPGPEGC